VPDVPAPVFTRPGLIGAAVLAVTAGTIGFANFSFGSAIVGERRQNSAEPAAAASIDAMKAEHSRPALIPFPKQNPYTSTKAALGKKLYFDPRLSAASAQSRASCHSPGFGWGVASITDVSRNPSTHEIDDESLKLVPPSRLAGAQ